MRVNGAELSNEFYYEGKNFSQSADSHATAAETREASEDDEIQEKLLHVNTHGACWMLVTFDERRMWETDRWLVVSCLSRSLVAKTMLMLMTTSVACSKTWSRITELKMPVDRMVNRSAEGFTELSKRIFIPKGTPKHD